MENEKKTQEVQGQTKEPKNRKKLIIIAVVCLLTVVLGVFALTQGKNQGTAGIPDRIETTTATQTPTTQSHTTVKTTTTTKETTTAETTSSETETTLTTLMATATPLVTVTPTATAKPTPAPKPGEPIPGNYVLVVYKGSQVVVAYEADINGKYDPKQAYRKMICSTGSSSGLTPNGTFKIYNKYAYRALQGSYGQYASRFNGGILFHSVPIAQSADTVEAGRSMMSTAAYNKLGSPASHGCVRMLVRDAKWIYNNCKLGTKVIVTGESSPVGGAGKPALKRYPPYTNSIGDRGWDPTDPHPDNPYNNPDIALVKSVSLNTKKAELKTGDSLQLEAQVKPENALEKSVSWSSSDETIAKVDKEGLVTALKEGTVVITVTTKDGGKTAKCTINVIGETETTTTPVTTIKPTTPAATKQTTTTVATTPATTKQTTTTVTTTPVATTQSTTTETTTTETTTTTATETTTTVTETTTTETETSTTTTTTVAEPPVPGDGE